MLRVRDSAQGQWLAFVQQDNGAFALHLFAGIVYVLWVHCLCSLTEQPLLNFYMQEVKGVLLRMSLAVESLKTFKHQVINEHGEGKLSIKLEFLMHGGLLYKLFFLNTLSSAFNSLAKK